MRPGGAVDRLELAVSIFLRAVPALALGVVLVPVFAVQLRLLPVAGFDGTRYLILPSLKLGLGLAAVFSRVVRDAVAEARSSEWHLFARTKGLDARLTVLRHVLRHATRPGVANVGVQGAYLIEGVVIIETVFA